MSKHPSKNANDTRRGKILLTAARLFIEQGYESTSMRQIAEGAGVSLSLANYHFGSKRNIGVRLIRGHLRTMQPYVSEYTRHDERLFAATLLRLNYNLMSRPQIRQFYIDTLVNDIYLDAITSGNVDKSKQRSLTKTQMYWVISDSYLTVGMERALALCPFIDLLEEDVPDFIIRNQKYHPSHGGKVEHTPEWYVAQSRELAGAIIREYPHLLNIYADIPKHIEEYM
jgi:AcrR family transcriptional regulator